MSELEPAPRYSATVALCCVAFNVVITLLGSSCAKPARQPGAMAVQGPRYPDPLYDYVWRISDAEQKARLARCLETKPEDSSSYHPDACYGVSTQLSSRTEPMARQAFRRLLLLSCDAGYSSVERACAEFFLGQYTEALPADLAHMRRLMHDACSATGAGVGGACWGLSLALFREGSQLEAHKLVQVGCYQRMNLDDCSYLIERYGEGQDGFAAAVAFHKGVRKLLEEDLDDEDDGSIGEPPSDHDKAWAQDSPEAVRAPDCSGCVERCSSERAACEGGQQAGCYLAAACLCSCHLVLGGCGSATGALARCVATNQQRAASLQSGAPILSDSHEQPDRSRTRTPEKPSGPTGPCGSAPRGGGGVWACGVRE